MMLDDVIKAIDEFSPAELREIRKHLDQREQQIELQAGTLDMEALLRGLEEIRAGLTEDEFREIEQAMNEEYVEPLDETE